jgi:hypothetical protein
VHFGPRDGLYRKYVLPIVRAVYNADFLFGSLATSVNSLTLSVLG